MPAVFIGALPRPGEAPAGYAAARCRRGVRSYQARSKRPGPPSPLPCGGIWPCRVGLVCPDDAGEGVAVPVVPDVVAHGLAFGAAALDLLGVDTLVVRVGADDLHLMSWRAVVRAVLAEQVALAVAAGADDDAVDHGTGDLAV